MAKKYKKKLQILNLQTLADIIVIRHLQDNSGYICTYSRARK